METNEKGTIVYQGKWGYYSCSYETYLKLKKLHKLYWETIRKLRGWFRFDRKAVQNRVIRERIKNERGQTIGRKIVGPMLEPTYNTMFGQPTDRKKWLNITIPELLNDHGIVEAYQNTRMPKSREEVTPLKLSEEQINELFAKLS